jgi:hypothetical protein
MVAAASGRRIGFVYIHQPLRIVVPSGLRSLLTTGPDPDGGGSNVNQRPHMPDKSGMDVALA